MHHLFFSPCLLSFLFHNNIKFLHDFIIQFLPELPCHRVSDILIDILSIIIQPTGLVIRHGNKYIAFLGDADTDSGHFKYIIQDDGCICLKAALLFLHGGYVHFDAHAACIDCVSCIIIFLHICLFLRCSVYGCFALIFLFFSTFRLKVFFICFSGFLNISGFP